MSVGIFHNFHRLINRHKRTIEISHFKAGYRDGDTTRFIKEGWDLPETIEGAIWFVTYKDLKRYPDFELEHSNIKLITSNDLLSGFVLKTKDKITFEGIDYYIIQLVKQEYYGNFYIAFLKEVEFAL